MISIEPSGELYLCVCPLENDGKNQLTFPDRRTQYNYFNTRIIKSTSNYTYIRTDDSVSVDIPIDKIINCNYLFYRNKNFTDRYYYCFITDMKYLSENSTLISFTTDVFQTWQFDINYKRCFIEREHVNDDAIGIHTVPENLESGEYIVEDQSSAQFMNAHVVVGATWDWVNEKTAGSYINGIYQGVIYYLIGDLTPAATISYLLNIYASKGKSDAIIGLFMVPDKLTNFDNIKWNYMSTEGGFSYYPYKTIDYLETDNSVDMGNFIVNKPYTSVNGYIPKNNKLFVYPYKYIMANNNNGSSAEYLYEQFSGSDCKFHTEGAITPGCSVRTVPLNYKGTNINNAEGMNLGKYPICSYTTDMYTNWLTQNSVNLGVSLASAGVTIVGGIGMVASGAGAVAGAGAITSGSLAIASTLSQVHQYKTIPPQSEGNINAGDVIYAGGKCTYSFYRMSIKAEYAKIIDDYFSMFGYKVNSLKKPNVTGRRNWNYIKTIDANFDGAFPQSDMQKIKNMFNSGITLWHNPTTIYDYSQDNSII